MEMIVLLKFEVDEDQLKDTTDDASVKMHILLQKYTKNVVERAIKEDGATHFKLIESSCARMFPDGKTIKHSTKKGIDGPPKMTGGE